MARRFGKSGEAGRLAAAAVSVAAMVLACSQAAPPGSARPVTHATSFRAFEGAPTVPQPDWARVTAGSSDHVCATVGDLDVYRSGDFAGSIGRAFVTEWRKHPGPIKVGWIPRDPAQGPLHIHGEREGGGTYDEDLGFAHSWLPSGSYFWPDNLGLTRGGHWTLRLTAGRESGCFVVEL